MQMDVRLPPAWLTEIGALARSAEQLGAQGIWLSENRHDALLAISQAAVSTSNVSIGSSVAMAFPRSPMITAVAAWDLQQLAGGRLTLGLGTQVRAHLERRFSVPWEAPAARMREYVEALRAIWDVFQNGGRLQYTGKYYQFSLMNSYWNPGPIEHPHIPVVVAAVGPAMLRLGRLADGVHLHSVATRKYLLEVVAPIVQSQAAPDGVGARATPSQPRGTVCATAYVITGRNQQELRESEARVREKIAFYASTPAYKTAVFDRHGWGDISTRLNVLAREGRTAEMAALLPDEMVDAVAVRGLWDEVGPRLVEKYADVVDRLIVEHEFRPGEMDEFWRKVAAVISHSRGPALPR